MNTYKDYYLSFLMNTSTAKLEQFNSVLNLEKGIVTHYFIIQTQGAIETTNIEYQYTYLMNLIYQF